MSRKQIAAALSAHMARAAAEARQAREEHAAGTLDEAGLARHLRAYVLEKYRLTPAGAAGIDGLEQLAEASLAKALGDAPDLAARETMSATCDGADSTVTKHALLMVAVQRDFGVCLDGYEAAYAETVADLAHLVWRGMHAPQAPRGR